MNTKALGVDFNERNELFDEAIEVLRGVWEQDDFAYEGRNFLAHGQTANPSPAGFRSGSAVTANSHADGSRR